MPWDICDTPFTMKSRISEWLLGDGLRGQLIVGQRDARKALTGHEE